MNLWVAIAIILVSLPSAVITGFFTPKEDLKSCSELIAQILNLLSVIRTA